MPKRSHAKSAIGRMVLAFAMASSLKATESVAAAREVLKLLKKLSSNAVLKLSWRSVCLVPSLDSSKGRREVENAPGSFREAGNMGTPREQSPRLHRSMRRGGGDF